MAYLLSNASVVSLSTKNTYFASNNWNKKNAMEIATAGLKQKNVTSKIKYIEGKSKFITTSSDFNSTLIPPPPSLSPILKSRVVALLQSYQRSLSFDQTKESKLPPTIGKMIWCPTTKLIAVKNKTVIVTPERKVQCSILQLQRWLL